MADAVQAAEPTVTATAYTVTCVPPGSAPQWYLWALKVEWRGEPGWAVLGGPYCLGTDGDWDFEPSPSSRTDEWTQAHRFDLDTALRLAREHAPKVNVNGMTPADVLAREAARRG